MRCEYRIFSYANSSKIYSCEVCFYLLVAVYDMAVSVFLESKTIVIFL
ncbi:hypothetical protein HMPREF3034_01157 [Prevotella sp. DNF00663]|nr:hypothetical protein HMPREF3034_01157 [Prevotella sp. DNF00663]